MRVEREGVFLGGGPKNFPVAKMLTMSIDHHVNN